MWWGIGSATIRRSRVRLVRHGGRTIVIASLDWGETALRLAAAAALGGVLGLEREIDGQDAGFRTHILLALGAALFGILSVGAFDVFVAERDESNVVVDVTRIASYVAAGVGFIGGGAILKHAGVVKGVTTATSIWATAAIGLAAGLGFWSGAVVATLVALVALALLAPVGKLAAHLQRRKASTLVLRVAPDLHLGDLVEMLRQHGGDIRSLDLDTAEGLKEIRVRFWSADSSTIARVVEALGSRSDVVSIQTATGGG